MPAFFSVRLLAGLLLIALLAGCGQKGPLYLPKALSQLAASQSAWLRP